MVDSREVRRRALQDADLKKLRRKLLFRFLLLFPLTYLIGVAAMALVIDGAPASFWRWPRRWAA